MMASNIRIPTLRELVTLGSEAWEAVREAFVTIKTEIEALQDAGGGGGGAVIYGSSDLLPAEPTDGLQAFVTTQKALYTAINGTWQRTATDTAWASQATWYLSSEGTADAAGGDSGHPVTYSEMVARLGSTPLATGVTIYVLDSLNLADATFLGQNDPDGTHWLYFEGVPSVVATGTIATSTDWAPATNTAAVITGSSSLVSHVGKLVRMTSGTSAGARFWILKNTSGTTVRLSQVMAGPDAPETTTLAPGDGYEVLSLPHFADKVTVTGGRDVEFALLGIVPTGEAHGLYVAAGSTSLFDACLLGGLDVDSGATVTMYGTRVVNGMRCYGKSNVIAYGCVGNPNPRIDGTMRLYDHCVQANQIAVGTQGAVICDDAARFIAAFDCPGAGGVVTLDARSLFRCDGYLIGSGNTTSRAHIQVCDGALCMLGNAPLLSGTGPELQVGGILAGTGGRLLTYADIPWTHPSGARIYLSGAATEPRPRPNYFESYLPTSTELLGTTSNTTSVRSHTLTLGGDHARTIALVLSDTAGSFAGPWTVTGTRNGTAQSESVNVSPDGGQTVETVKTYDPGTVTVSRPAQNNTFGSYTINVGSGFGLTLKAYEGATGVSYAGHVLSITTVGPLQVPITAVASITGPTASPPYGKFQLATGQLDTFTGDPFEVLFLAVE